MSTISSGTVSSELLSGPTLGPGADFTGAVTGLLNIGSGSSTQVSINFILTNSSTPPTQGREVKVHYGFSDNGSLTGAAIASQVGPGSNSFIVRANQVASGVINYMSQPITVTGAYIYVWVTYDDLGPGTTVATLYVRGV